MSEVKVRRPDCISCPHHLPTYGTVPQVVKGVTLRPGSRYCIGGKRPRMFKSRDPKKMIPSWCPKQNIPPVLRIYTFKSTESWILQSMLVRDGVINLPMAHSYAVRYTGESPISAYSYEDIMQEKTTTEVFEMDIKVDEVLEIDDGLKPYYFHKTAYGMSVILFNGETARKNKLEVCENE